MSAIVLKRSSATRAYSLKWLSIWFGGVLGLYTTYVFSQSSSPLRFFQEQSSVPLIVAWTAYFRDTISNKLKTSLANCPFRCDIVERSTRDHRIPSAYILHGRDINVSDLPERRYPNQLMVFMLFEPPPYAGRAWQKLPPNYFNATMTYRKSSDYPLPYGKFVRRSSIDKRQMVFSERQIQKAMKRKTNGALLLMSRCLTYSDRESVIRRLSAKINITIVGRCTSAFPGATSVYCPDSTRGDKCEEELVESHRFYLAFENSLCRDYITEKFFLRISQLMIPIVVNRAFYEGNGIPPSSFIALDDFKNDDELANHLNELQHNSKLFLKYFEWTKYYRKPSSYVSDAACRLCADLYANKRLQVKDIQKFNSYKHQCSRGDSRNLL
uniref:Fucosyltransferase n=1 Tax=Haemonchus contortus TaxID=6289 RepID=A0A7I5E768_HAECO